MNQLIQRMIRAAKLDVSLYEEVEADPKALNQAWQVVALSSVAAGLAVFSVYGVIGLIQGTMASLIGWFIWSYLTFLIGTKFLPEPQTKADYGQLLRTIGFASAPGVIRIFGVIPPLAPAVGFIASVWMLTAMIIAVRQALDYTNSWRAIGVCLIGWVFQLLAIALLLQLMFKHTP